MDWSEWVILSLLGVFSVRDIVAAFGNIPRNDKWYSKLVYGNYDKNLISKILSDWGYSDRIQKEFFESNKRIAFKGRKKGVKDYYQELIFLLAKYTMNFSEDVYYSEDVNSKYYVDTMEASTSPVALTKMTGLMTALISQSTKKKPDVIVVPKGGNVELAESVARSFGATLVVVKDKNDYSRVTSTGGENKDCYKVNLEGSWTLFDERKHQAVLVDCNTSKGTQLVFAANEFNSAVNNGMKAKKISDVFVLYRVDSRQTSTDEMFQNEGYTLHRFFDLNEELKDLLFSLNPKCTKKGSTRYDNDIKKEIDYFLSLLIENDMLHFKENEM